MTACAWSTTSRSTSPTGPTPSATPGTPANEWLRFLGNSVVALLLAEPQALFMLEKTGAWGAEGVAVYFFAGIVIALLGSGKYSVMSDPRWR